MANPTPSSAPDAALPPDATRWLRRVFARINKLLARSICEIPTLQETWLDGTLIHELMRVRPVVFPSGVRVTLEAHFLGGLRHWRRWEIADIGLLVMFRHRGQLFRSKVALLQSKRLYPDEQEFDEAELADYQLGFVRLFRDQRGVVPHVPRTFTMSTASSYKAFTAGDEQYKAIETFEHAKKVPVFYLFYNPMDVPWTTTLPGTPVVKLPSRNSLGCRVVPANLVRATVGAKDGHHPSLGEVQGIKDARLRGRSLGGWRLETFVVDRLVGCKEGHIVDLPTTDNPLEDVFYRRSGPIAAAFGVTIDLDARPD